MWLEALLAYAHLLAILGWVVFLTSTAAVARAEWFSAAVVTRLATVDRIASAAAAGVVLTGLARMAWGVKGWGWYATQPLLWTKLALLAWMLVQGWRSSRQIAAWRHRLDAGALPTPDEIAALRRRVMGAAHLMLLIPLAAVLLARGLWTV